MSQLKAEASPRRSLRYELDTALGHLTPTERAARGTEARLEQHAIRARFNALAANAGSGVRKLLGAGLLARRLEASGHQKLGQLIAGSDEFDLDRCEAFIVEVQRIRGGSGEVDDAILRYRTAVVYGDDD